MRRRIVAILALVLGFGAIGAATASSASAAPTSVAPGHTITVNSADYWW